MSETKYDVVECRVPAGLLREGETLEFRKPRDGERCLSGYCGVAWCRDWKDESQVPVIIPPFDANLWAEKNLPKPACELEVVAMVLYDRQRWHWTCDEDTSSWKSIQHVIGPDPFLLPWKQSKFKWCRHVPSYDEDHGRQPEAEWAWSWQGCAA